MVQILEKGTFSNCLRNNSERSPNEIRPWIFSTSLVFISCAEAREKVITSIRRRSCPSSKRRTIFSIITVVLPLPAEAETRVFPCERKTAFCSSLHRIAILPSVKRRLADLSQIDALFRLSAHPRIRTDFTCALYGIFIDIPTLDIRNRLFD